MKTHSWLAHSLLILFGLIIGAVAFLQTNSQVAAQAIKIGTLAQNTCNQTCSPVIPNSCGTGLSCVAIANPCAPGVSCPQSEEVTTYRCRNNSCQSETDCTCNTPTPTPVVTPTNLCNRECDPGVTNYCGSGLSCVSVSIPCTGDLSCPQTGVTTAYRCRNNSCKTDADCVCSTPTPTPIVVNTPTPTPAAGLLACNQQCTSNSQCQSGYCYQPPAPTCPPGLACTLSFPPKVCRLESNPTSTTCQATDNQTVICRADLNQDKIVDITDYSFMLADFLKTIVDGASPRSDYNQDGLVDISDWNIFRPILLENFFSRCEDQLSAPTS